MIVGATDELTLELAAYLCERQESIIAEWLEAVHRDEHIPATESITAHQLRDHLPMMFNDLADTLRSDVDPEDEIAGHENAITHGHHRWEQGYQLEEVLRELARVRVILLEHILRFEEQQPEFRGEVRRIALRRLYFFFDQMVTRSAAQFVHEQQADLRARNQHLRAVDDSRLRLLRISTHDLRNSLNAAHLSAEVLAGEDDPVARREEVTALARNLGRTTALLNDLLTFSTLFDAANSPRKVSLRLGELFAELVEEFRPVAEAKGLGFNAEWDRKVDVVVSDPTKLRQIADNLLSNAVKYSEQGHVALRISAVAPDKWTIVVEDTGRGIAPAEREHLFREYHRVAETAHVQGTGLGLFIVKRLVDLLHGEIRVESEPGRGSRFEVILPLS